MTFTPVLKPVCWYHRRKQRVIQPAGSYVLFLPVQRHSAAKPLCNHWPGDGLACLCYNLQLLQVLFISRGNLSSPVGPSRPVVTLRFSFADQRCEPVASGAVLPHWGY